MDKVFRHLYFFPRRYFASKYPKGSFGNEQTLAANSGFPKHKELMAEDYYEDEADDREIPMNYFKSPVLEQAEKLQETMDDDDIRDMKSNMTMEGGVLKNYKKLKSFF